MIWTLVRIILFVAAVAAVTVGASYVIDVGGEVRVAIGTIEFTLTPLAAIIAILLILLAGWLIFRLVGLLMAVVRFLNGDETAISRYFDRNRERKGFNALAEGLMALASGEGRVALAKAAKAEKFLRRPELTLLISAQAAEMTGDTRRAQEYYKKLLTDEKTRFVGISGILKQKLAEGDTDTALKLAQKAFALRPRHEKTLDTLFALQSRKHDWKGARQTLQAKLRAKVLPKDVHARRDAVLALADAREKIEAGDIEAGRIAALQANRLSPDLIPAAVLAAEMHALNNASRKAVAVLKKAWSVQPHPDLAAAFAELQPDETPQERRKRFQPLLKLKPDHPETRMLEAELAIVAGDFAAARKAMGDLAETDPTIRALTIMAAIERGEGSPDEVVRGWLARALGASRGPQWICGNCHHIHAEWVPICENCGGFDTLSWEVPPPSAGTSAGTTDMLPLIVGAIEDKTDKVVEDVESTPESVAESIAESVAESATESRPAEIAEVIDESPDRPVVHGDGIIAEQSEDLDGILGDPHVVPEAQDRKS